MPSATVRTLSLVRACRTIFQFNYDRTRTIRGSSGKCKHFCSGICQPQRFVSFAFRKSEILLLAYLLSKLFWKKNNFAHSLVAYCGFQLRRKEVAYRTLRGTKYSVKFNVSHNPAQYTTSPHYFRNTDALHRLINKTVSLLLLSRDFSTRI